MLSAKSSKNCPDQNWANFGGFKGLRVRGFKKLQFLPQKAHVFVNPRPLSHFASKSVEGCDLQIGWGKTSHRDSHRKDMSPLTQGLNYRSACDGGIAHMPIALAHSFVVLASCLYCWFFSYPHTVLYCIVSSYLWNTHFHFCLGGQSRAISFSGSPPTVQLFVMIDIVAVGNKYDDDDDLLTVITVSCTSFC